MSMQPPAAPHRVAIANIDIPFWRMVMILVKWSFAAIPAAIIVTLIFMALAAIIGVAVNALGGGGNLQQMLRGLLQI
jgi:hypothetical protein